MNDISNNVTGTMMARRRLARCWLDLPAHIIDRLTHGAAEVAASHAVLDRDVARVALAVDGGRAIVERYLAELCKGDAFSGRREQADVGDIFHAPPKLRLIAHRQIESLLADKNLADGFSADGRFHGVLNIADIDAVAVCRATIHIEVDVGLASDLKRA
jgi:hypothetical protein